MALQSSRAQIKLGVGCKGQPQCTKLSKELQMSAQRKSSKSAAKSTQKPAAQEQAPALATIQPVERVAPEERRGKSQQKFPVAFTWVLCHNAFATARKEGKPAPRRTDLVKAAMDAGVAYYTARTQVQAYIKASKHGTQVPAQLPRGVTIPGTEQK